MIPPNNNSNDAVGWLVHAFARTLIGCFIIDCCPMVFCNVTHFVGLCVCVVVVGVEGVGELVVGWSNDLSTATTTNHHRPRHVTFFE